MTDLNSVTIIGRLTRDLGQRDFAYTSGGTAKAKVSIAVNRGVKRGDQWVEDVSYFDVVIWGKMAENLRSYLTKGKQIAVEGYLNQERWEKDGQKHSRVAIVANNVQLLGGINGQTALRQEKKHTTENKFSYAQQDTDAPQGQYEEFQEDIPF